MTQSTGTVTIARAMMGSWKKEGNHFTPNNEENRSLDPDSKKTKINYAKEPSEAQKNTVKEEILQVINENFIEMLMDMVNQNVQKTLKKFQATKIENLRKHKKKIKETIEALYKHQSETKNTIRDINELKMKTDNIKEKVTHDMENLRKKNETGMQNKMESLSSRLEQAEDRIPELERNGN
jgi:hypothetical protein